jgi:UDP-N-acetyl-D-mannosaminuronate dehydrogenase
MNSLSTSIRLFKVKYLLLSKLIRVISVRNINDFLPLYVIYEINGYLIRNVSSIFRLINSYILILELPFKQKVYIIALSDIFLLI